MVAKLVDSRLFLNVNGGATLAQGFDADLVKGRNTISLPKIGKDVSSDQLDVLENVAKGTQPGKLTLEKAVIHQRGRVNKGAELTVRAEQAGNSHFTVTAGLNASVSIKHRLSITAEGVAEWSSRAQITNSGKTPIERANLTITAGDTQNSGGGRRFARSAAMLESVSSDSTVSQAGSSVYRLDHPTKLSLAAGASVQINLFNKDFAVGAVDKKLTFEGYGASVWGRESGSSEDGPVQSSYEIANSAKNGMGVILPRGEVQILRPDGTLLSNASIGDTSLNKTIKLDGGQAFDMESTRQQLSYAVKSSRSLGEHQGKMSLIEVSSELTFKNRGPVDEAIDFSDRIQASQDDEKPAKVSAVKVDGVELAANQWKYDADNGLLSVPGLPVKAGGEAKVSYTLETSIQN